MSETVLGAENGVERVRLRAKYLSLQQMKAYANLRNRRLRNLGCAEEVMRRVMAGHTLTAIAKFIQEEKKECLDITFHSLIVALAKFRKDMRRSELPTPQIRVDEKTLSPSPDDLAKLRNEALMLTGARRRR